MHSSANCLEDGSNSCVLFGLSGTGKTTLSASHERYLIGDDEIVWSHTGISNLEGSCYAKLIDLSLESEPEIFRAVYQFGSIMKNVGYDPRTGLVDFSDRTKTENTRGSYSLEALSKVFPMNKEAEAPRSIVFLTADAFGVMPAVARLDEWQAQYYFVSGYTAKVAGTELGVKEPQAAFSTCFGAPFMPRPSSVYAGLLAEFAKKSGAQFWLLNTGWMSGGYGKSQRYPLKVSRQILAAIQSGELAKQKTKKHFVFNFEVPAHCPNIGSQYLEFDDLPGAKILAEKFHRNMENFSAHMEASVFKMGGLLCKLHNVEARGGKRSGKKSSSFKIVGALLGPLLFVVIPFLKISELSHEDHVVLGLVVWMMLPMVLAVAKKFSKHSIQIEKALLFGVAYAASIGGVGTIIGSPPNAILMGYLEANGLWAPSFMRWFIMAAPLLIFGLLSCWLVIRFFYLRGGISIGDLQKSIEFPRWSKNQKRVLIVFVLTAMAWILRPLMPGTAITDTWIAVAAIIVLYLVPSAETKGEALLGIYDLSKVSWSILLLFGGGTFCTYSGIPEWAARSFSSHSSYLCGGFLVEFDILDTD